MKEKSQLLFNITSQLWTKSSKRLDDEALVEGENLIGADRGIITQSGLEKLGVRLFEPIDRKRHAGSVRGDQNDDGVLAGLVVSGETTTAGRTLVADRSVNGKLNRLTSHLLFTFWEQVVVAVLFGRVQEVERPGLLSRHQQFRT